MSTQKDACGRLSVSCNKVDSGPDIIINKPRTGVPTCFLVLGMASSGKTTIVKKLVENFYSTGYPYVANLDPTRETISYPVNFDIKEALDMPELTKQNIMNKENLQPIVDVYEEKLNIIIDDVEESDGLHDYIVLDTLWELETNANVNATTGSLLTRVFSSKYPTVIIYVLDSAKNNSPNLFMTNLLHATSLISQSKCPLIMVFNKVDIVTEIKALRYLDSFRNTDDCYPEFQILHQFLVQLNMPIQNIADNLKTCISSSVAGIGYAQFFDMIEESIDQSQKQRQFL